MSTRVKGVNRAFILYLERKNVTGNEFSFSSPAEAPGDAPVWFVAMYPPDSPGENAEF